MRRKKRFLSDTLARLGLGQRKKQPSWNTHKGRSLRLEALEVRRLLAIDDLASIDGGDPLNVMGTTEPDVFEIVAGSPHQVSINGAAPQMVDGLLIIDGDIDDRVVITGTEANDTARLWPNETELITADGHSIHISGVAEIELDGGDGRDRVVFYDSSGRDEFVGWQAGGWLHDMADDD